jgi:hypothetical protein
LFPTRLRNFARLPASERRLALRAIGWLIVSRAGLRFLGFDRVHAFMARAAPRKTVSHDEWPRAVRRAVLRAARSVPGSSCLAQSLAAEHLLRAAGHRARLSIGVAHTPNPRGTGVALDAHAWVESGGVLVTGDDARDRYRLLTSFGTE